MRHLLVSILLLGALSCSKETTVTPVVGGHADSEPLHRFEWVSDRISRGAQPVGDAAFAALAEKGVKTVISVDGAIPDVETAKRHGLRYVHVPMGYDGMPDEVKLRLAKTVREVEGPFYVHCHHGKHRGPVAAVAAQMSLGNMSVEEALAELGRAQTAEQYTGLWGSIRGFVPPAAEATAELEYDFPSEATVEEIAAAMALIDRLYDNLTLSREAYWRQPEDHPDVDPPHEALQVLESLTEIGRAEETASRPEDFRAWLAAGTSAARDLESALRADPFDVEKAEIAFDRLAKSCKDCHDVYRNLPHGDAR